MSTKAQTEERARGRTGARLPRTGLGVHRMQVGAWLLAMAGLVALMVLVGGATRLTDSGLSITEWQPVTGVMPPLSDAAWQEEFAKYKQIPEYSQVNRGMSLDAFKRIYWWEWGHRLLGRLTGLAFAAGILFFLVTRRLGRTIIPRLVLLFLLGGLQGALGWYMVQSGLSERVDVSQYRLAAHLGLAVLLFGALLWTAMGLMRRSAAPPRAGVVRPLLIVFAVLVFVQILLGAFVAGLDAGLSYTTWPLMDGDLVPAKLFTGMPWYEAVFEDRLTVQFLHRLGGYAVAAWALSLWLHARIHMADAGVQRVLTILLILVALQAALGVLTLIQVVPLPLALAHQAGALAVFAVALYAVHLGHGLGVQARPSVMPPGREVDVPAV